MSDEINPNDDCEITLEPLANGGKSFCTSSIGISVEIIPNEHEESANHSISTLLKHYFDAGNQHLTKNEKTLAVASYLSCLAIDVNFYQALVRLGEVEWSNGNYYRSARYMLRALRLHEDPRCYKLLSQAYSQCSLYNKAFAAIDRAVKTDPLDLDCLIYRFNIGIYKATISTNVAIELSYSVHAFTNDHPGLLFGLGLISIILDKYDTAMSFFCRGFTYDSNYRFSRSRCLVFYYIFSNNCDRSDCSHSCEDINTFINNINTVDISSWPDVFIRQDVNGCDFLKTDLFENLCTLEPASQGWYHYELAVFQILVDFLRGKPISDHQLSECNSLGIHSQITFYSNIVAHIKKHRTIS